MSDVEELLTRTLADERRGLPAAPGLVPAALAAGRRSRQRRRVATGAGLVVAAAGVWAALGTGAGQETLQPTRPQATTEASPTRTPVPAAAPSPAAPAAPQHSVRASVLPRLLTPQNTGVPARITGVVADARGRSLPQIRILSADLERLLGRTDARGRFSVGCRRGLVFSAYAFGAPTGPRAQPSRYEESPGAGNFAFRTVVTTSACGRRLTVTMPTGGVVEGRPDPDHRPATVYLSRVVGGSRNDADGTKRFGWFAAPVRSDGTYRIEGLATGRYSIETSYEGFPDEATFVDVVEGRTSDGSYTYTQDPAVCYDQPPSSDCPGATTPPPAPTS